MILDRLVLKNFGPYRGEHALNFSVTTDYRRIILIGGMNGFGKTTILDAIQLALYGKLARTSNRGVMPYSTYLRKCVNRDAPQREGASVKIVFRHIVDQTEVTYSLTRLWRVTGRGLVETFEARATTDGELRDISADWPSVIEEILPQRMSQLFFFDGEKIEQLADPTTSAEFLATAVHSLLGLDLVDRLVTDLTVMERRKRTNSKKLKGSASPLKTLEQELEVALADRQALLQERAALKTRMARKLKMLAETEQEFEREGGLVWEQLTDLETERRSLSQGISNHEEWLRKAAEGSLPLLLIRDILERVYEQGRAEQEFIREKILCDALEHRDRWLVRKLTDLGIPIDTRVSIENFLTAERSRRQETIGENSYLNIGAEVLGRIKTLLTSELKDEQQKTLVELKILQDFRIRLDNIERTIAGVPDEATIVELYNKRATILAEVDKLTADEKKIQENIEHIERTIEATKAQLTRELKRLVEIEVQESEDRRILTHSMKARETLEKFRRRVLMSRLVDLEKAIFKSFTLLLHKERFIERIGIDPGTFEVTLYTRGGEKISTERLSAGERQLFAVAVLWGLGSATSRSLPVIIDTPLGRLDSKHRERLIDIYFPHAGHQVILLSTDEEIDENLASRFEPHIARSYLLKHNNDSGSTEIQSGYFFGVAHASC